MSGINMEAVRAYHAGQLQAQRLLSFLRGGVVAQDLLHDELRAVLLAGEPEALRGFCRELQKAQERAR
jgi:hypothetical protein